MAREDLLRREINGLAMVDLLSVVKRRMNRYLALLLNDIEEVLGEDSEEFHWVRKAVLDHFNDYTRSIFSVLIGDDIEGLVFR